MQCNAIKLKYNIINIILIETKKRDRINVRTTHNKENNRLFKSYWN